MSDLYHGSHGIALGAESARFFLRHVALFKHLECVGSLNVPLRFQFLVSCLCGGESGTEFDGLVVPLLAVAVSRLQLVDVFPEQYGVGFRVRAFWLY